MEVDKICRTCLDSNGPFLPIYDNSASSRLAYMIICNFTKTKPELSDNLPDQVCFNCVSEMNQCNSFRLKCKNSDKTLRQILLDSKPEKRETAFNASQKVSLGDKATQISRCTNTISAITTNSILVNQYESKETGIYKSKTTNKNLTPLEVRHKNKIENPKHEKRRTKDGIRPQQELKQINNTLFEVVQTPSIEPIVCGVTKPKYIEGPKGLHERKGGETNAGEDENQSLDNGDNQKKHNNSLVKSIAVNRNQLGLCDYCGKLVYSHWELKNHTRTHTGERPFNCETCSRSFTKRHNLIAHQHTHTGLKPFLCTKCGKSFARKRTLTLHQLTHSTEKPFECDICNKSFSRKLSLQNHQIVHTGETPFTCNQCDKKFSQKRNMETHQLRIHQRTHTTKRTYTRKRDIGKRNIGEHTNTGLRPYQCNQCSKSFSQKRSLEDHQRTHDGLRPYHCEKCSKTFKIVSQLKVHQRIHTGEMPFRCNHCNKSFRQKCNMVAHVRTHTGEKPYQCTVCSKSFALDKTLKVHQRTHAGVS